MRLVSMKTRDELVAAVRRRYVGSGRAEKTQILDEFVAVTGHHRKHAMRLLRGDDAAVRGEPRPTADYDDGVGGADVGGEDGRVRKGLKALVPLLGTWGEVRRPGGRVRMSDRMEGGARGG